MNRELSLRHGSRRRMSHVDNQTLSPGWYGGTDRRWASAWVLCLRTACWSWTFDESQTLSLSLNQKSTAGTSDGCPSQGNKEGWYPSTHWKAVRPVECWRREFCAYSVQGRKWFHPCWFWWQKLRRYHSEGTAQCPGSSALSGRWTVDDTRMWDLQRPLGGWRRLVRPWRWTEAHDQRRCLQGGQSSWKRDGIATLRSAWW